MDPDRALHGCRYGLRHSLTRLTSVDPQYYVTLAGLAERLDIGMLPLRRFRHFPRSMAHQFAAAEGGPMVIAFLGFHGRYRYSDCSGHIPELLIPGTHSLRHEKVVEEDFEAALVGWIDQVARR